VVLEELQDMAGFWGVQISRFNTSLDGAKYCQKRRSRESEPTTAAHLPFPNSNDHRFNENYVANPPETIPQLRFNAAFWVVFQSGIEIALDRNRRDNIKNKISTPTLQKFNAILS